MPELPQFHNASLLQMALTHRSYANENCEVDGHNERLEFLGDALLNFLVGEWLYQQYPNLPEGRLTPMRSTLVDEKQLAELARSLNLGARLRLGKGAELEGGRQNPNLLSSAFEAVVGAYFLDCNSDVKWVRDFIEPLFRDALERLDVAGAAGNYKSLLQEWALANQGKHPEYRIVSYSGPDHAREFVAEVQIAGKPYGRGTGRRKQDAEKAAAKAALTQLGAL